MFFFKVTKRENVYTAATDPGFSIGVANPEIGGADPSIWLRFGKIHV